MSSSLGKTRKKTLAQYAFGCIATALGVLLIGIPLFMGTLLWDFHIAWPGDAEYAPTAADRFSQVLAVAAPAIAGVALMIVGISLIRAARRED